MSSDIIDRSTRPPVDELALLKACAGLLHALEDDCRNADAWDKLMSAAVDAIYEATGDPWYGLNRRYASTLQNSNYTDDLAVDRFAAAMKAKQRAKGFAGWDDASVCPARMLQSSLLQHAAKGDLVDVGNLAMMLFCRGEGTIADVSAPNDAPDDVRLLPELEQQRDAF